MATIKMIFDTKHLIATDKDDMLKLLSTFRTFAADLSIKGVIKISTKEYEEVCGYLSKIAKICKLLD